MIDPSVDICTCGVPRSLHKGLRGHGPCPAVGCPQFTWSHFADTPCPSCGSGSAILHKDRCPDFAKGLAAVPVVVTRSILLPSVNE